MRKNKTYNVIGIMSGSSLDGLDIAFCRFDTDGKIWKYQILKAETLDYDKSWKSKLTDAASESGYGLTCLHKEYGLFLAGMIKNFIKKYSITPDFVASHGHTVFHRPENGITFQLGEGAAIAAECGLPVVCDFRTLDVALGGQGAPLVPVGDKLLFHEYDFCLNLGGIANISFDNHKRERIAFDICPANIVLNDLANKLGKEFDMNGKIASKGKINSELLDKLNSLSFYKRNPPKSLGREWIEKYFFPVLNSFSVSIQDKLRTVCVHIAIQIALDIKSAILNPQSSILITGGGAYNKFLIDRIIAHSAKKVILPNDKTIQFKEAMAFAFLGVLRTRNEINCLRSVTGASKNSCCGVIYLPE